MGQNIVSREQLVVVGKIGAPFGVHGWLKVNSFTDPETNIWNFKDWFLLESSISTNCTANSQFRNNNISNREVICIPRIEETKAKFLVLFEGVLDRTNAAKLTNRSIAIKKSELPALKEGQYYWADLIGAQVYNSSNYLFGVLDHVFVTAANDVMVIKNNQNHANAEYLIPYSLDDVVIKVDVKNKIIIVNWVVE